ncbi:methylenetetrahydrofolate reductase 1 [Naganishia albida]|nr:methylenetetrahydrofolate reductase 1 [Naganishia albida]
MTKLTQLIQSTHPFHTFEFFPPRTPQGLANLLDRIHRLISDPLAPPIGINVTWGAGGSTALKSLELAEEIVKLVKEDGKEDKVQVVLHLTCTNMGRKLLDQALAKCRQLGIQNILALRGDPPRKEEYRPAPGSDSTSLSSTPPKTQQVGDLDASEMLNEDDDDDDEDEFTYAEDLVRYIRDGEGGDWFCIGVAGYPTPHVDSPSPESDIHFLSQKVQAGADFIITQLFYDVEGFIRWAETVRKAGVQVPIIPGLMPIQNYASFRRLINLCKCPVPTDIIGDLDPIKSDDAAVKRYGITLATKMIRTILDAKLQNVQGVHFCTLNLEKSVRTIMENLGWVVSHQQHQQNTFAQHHLFDHSAEHHRNLLIEQGATMAPNTGDATTLGTSPSRQLQELSISPQQAAEIAESGFRHRQQHQHLPPTTATGGTAVGTPAVPGPHMPQPGGGVVEDWDEYPNGRFTDVRSPAYGEIDGYGNGLKVTPAQALKDWGAPVDAESLSSLFTSYLQSSPKTPTTPFCDLPISPESQTILHYLIHLNSPQKQMWTVGSQPAVDGARSDDPIHGFGPKGGYVFQKSFVEFFVGDVKQVLALQEKIEKEGQGAIKFYAGNKRGEFISNLENEDVNSVTWAVFPGQEIVTSTQIQEESFLAWKEEAFEIWTEWSRLYPQRSASRKLLQGIADNAWLVSVIHHDYKDPEGLWRFLLGEDYEAVRQMAQRKQ